MKKAFLFLMLALSMAATFSSCNKDKEYEEEYYEYSEINKSHYDVVGIWFSYTYNISFVFYKDGIVRANDAYGREFNYKYSLTDTDITFIYINSDGVEGEHYHGEILGYDGYNFIFKIDNTIYALIKRHN